MSASDPSLLCLSRENRAPRYDPECCDRDTSQPGGDVQTYGLSHEDAVTPVGHHFRLPGHHPHSDTIILPIEKFTDFEPFLLYQETGHGEEAPSDERLKKG
jgi:hypothetical protein